jgi:8-oxo-dGTP diphosphatase
MKRIRLSTGFFFEESMGYPLLVTAALIEHDGLVLITQRMAHAPYPLYWEFPGGKVEPDEDPADCVVREIREELSMEISVEGVYDVIYHRYPERTVLVIAYRCRWLSGALQELGVAGHQWVAYGELPGYRLLPADIPLAEKLSLEGGQ